MLLALRVNVLAKGHSGVSPETLDKLLLAFNHDCLSVVPQKGTVGASGDLAQLSHLALGLMGEGLMWAPDGSIGDAATILAKAGLTPLKLGAKEGLAMINGTQLITSLGAEAVERAANVSLCADVAVALSLEALKGTPQAYHASIHSARPHKGQILVAARLRALLQPENPSEIFKSHRFSGRVQDAYSLRCAPQVHGVVNDTIEFVSSVLTTEMNSATDNPMVFTGTLGDEWVNLTSKDAGGVSSISPPAPSPSTVSSSSSSSSSTAADEAPKSPVRITGKRRRKDDAHDTLESAQEEIRRLRRLLARRTQVQQRPRGVSFHDTYRGGGGFIISGGNFHGEYPSKMLDYLAIAVSELGSISERRLERLVNPALSELPAFLVADGGINSGFMIAHCTSAALVSENKGLCHPASVDSISTSGAKEDHVSMGGFAARKVIEVVNNVETIIAIEIAAACQALEFFNGLKTTEPLQAVYNLVRKGTKPWDNDRVMQPVIEAVAELVRSGKIAATVEGYISESAHMKRAEN